MKVTIDFTRHFRNLPKNEQTKMFNSKKEARDWLMEGICGTDGAERDHYVDMLCALSAGDTKLFY